ncbi:protein kinase C-binding protein 1-like isoform X2 [Hyposmocoma kahamanoa]|uniref:protein kinase C-binding protein 1-like isoform X2 n=1 Tax=Hyposmocoma kahamanoa TaxID=1477025 RepID=UPI000E6D83E1|nr:protein kinase C-binding protein 1-like isoform X2 [Hyposmocoma kahamanoa]
MEEDTEARMDTGVSSTTDCILEVQEIAAPHRNVETVITVEEVKEELSSPNKDKNNQHEVPPADDSQPPKSAEKSLQKEVPIKKIIIKRSAKPFQLQNPIQKSPNKSEDTQKMLGNEVPISPNKSVEAPNKCLESSNKSVESVNISLASVIFKELADVKDTAAKSDSQKSPSNDNSKTVLVPTIAEVPKSPQKTPIKNVQISTSKKTLPKTTPPKEPMLKVTTVKEQPTKIIISKDIPKLTQDKDQINWSRVDPIKITPVREQPKSTPAKDVSEKPLETIVSVKLDEDPKSILSMDLDKEASNDSQVDTNSDISEKEHNKSISRELKSLIKSAKESKIISECNQLTSKTRKSRTPLDTSITNLNASVEADKIQGARRGSDNSQKSTSSEMSDKTAFKRSMRSQNPEFVSKVKNFLNSVTGKVQKEGEASDDEVQESKIKKDTESFSLPKKKKVEEEDQAKLSKPTADPYCWRCHYTVELAPNEKVHNPMQCSVCPRSYHYKCLSGPERNKINLEKNWVCPECLLILQAENSETRSPAMKKISLGMLCELLKYALERMMDLNGVEPFMHPVDRTLFPDYDKYVVHSMDLTLMKQHISDGMYGSTEAFLSDAQWILHNSIIFNTLQSKLTAAARGLVRSCRAEMGEIEACPECYAAAHARRPTWFTDVCSTPHILLWAKLKGFPYWPAKGMTVNTSGLVDVRFFGAHDRAWVPARDCFLYSEKDPNNFRTKRQDILDSMQEAEQHIRNISRKYGKFVYPPFKTQFDPTRLNEQIKMMIPTFEGEVRSPVKDKTGHASPGSVKTKSRSNSKSSKCSFHDGEGSESEESGDTSRKMSMGSENTKQDDSLIDKDKPDKSVEIVKSHGIENETSRKRRRSDLEEAVFTILDSIQPPVKEKRRRLEVDVKTEDKKSDTKEPKSKIEVAKSEREREKPKDGSTVLAKCKDSKEPLLSSNEKGKKIKVISISKVMKTAKPTDINVHLLKEKDNVKTPPKQKVKSEKSGPPDKDKTTPHDDRKSQKRRNSKNNKSINTSVAENKIIKATDSVNKEKSNSREQNTEPEITTTEKSPPVKSRATSSDSSGTIKERIQFDDDTSLAVIARKSARASSSSLPTISNVRSLSEQTCDTSKGNSAQTVETTVEATSDSSIFTPTSTDNVRNMKEAVNKLQKLRNETDPPVGRVGVRAFARMTSPPAPASAPEARPNNNSNVQVEIKAEPMDYDDPERHMEKMDLMNAFRLRPVNPTNLREVRINKVVVTPLTRMMTPNQPNKPIEVRPRAKKTFPQPKKPDDGRSELNSKNSMVYIPIQPPMTQAPIRLQRPVTNGPTSNASVSRTITTGNTSTANNAVNTVTSPLVPAMCLANSTATSTSTPSSSAAIPTVGQVPTTVHTVPLITTVNGQWTFSLQPVMSVGGVDGSPSPPVVNGLSERASAPAVVPIAPATSVTTPANLPTAPPALVSPVIAQPSRSTTENSLPGEPPRLQQRPALMNPLDPNTPVGTIPPPSSVGPLTAKLNQNVVKMTDFFRTLLEDCMEKLEEPVTQLTMLKLQLEQSNWRHQQQIEEIKHNYELVMVEMRSSFEKEKSRLVSETRRAAQVELETAVKITKTKQWCANCSQEAQFYCCWNTSYCDYPCQRAHWSQHYAICTQQRGQDCMEGDNPDSRLQPPPDTLPKTTAAPSLTAANKLAPSRVYTEQQPHVSQKPSIIVSMVEDTSGNQTMKCVGTYKPPSNAQVSPMIINKQLGEESSKKVVTSGGYLIVGASNSASSSTTIVNPPRRSNAIQYIS